jgi:hypothetical protein
MAPLWRRATLLEQYAIDGYTKEHAKAFGVQVHVCMGNSQNDQALGNKGSYHAFLGMNWLLLA